MKRRTMRGGLFLPGSATSEPACGSVQTGAPRDACMARWWKHSASQRTTHGRMEQPIAWRSRRKWTRPVTGMQPSCRYPGPGTARMESAMRWWSKHTTEFLKPWLPAQDFQSRPCDITAWPARIWNMWPNTTKKMRKAKAFSIPVIPMTILQHAHGTKCTTSPSGTMRRTEEPRNSCRNVHGSWGSSGWAAFTDLETHTCGWLPPARSILKACAVMEPTTNGSCASKAPWSGWDNTTKQEPSRFAKSCKARTDKPVWRLWSTRCMIWRKISLFTWASDRAVSLSMKFLTLA